MLECQYAVVACSLNEDFLRFRASLLGMLKMFGVFEPWIHEGVVADAVFKVAAVFPMKGMKGMLIGVPQEGLPFDVQEFMSQVAKS